MFTFIGDTVLDPFLGSGTTAKVALELKRNAIGYEINESTIRLNTGLVVKFLGVKIDKKDDTTRYLKKYLLGKNLLFQSSLLDDLTRPLDLHIFGVYNESSL